MTRRVALVTGAASGIGLATAQRLVEAGYDLALVDIDRSAIASACQRLERIGSRVIGIPADIASEPDLDRAIRCVSEKFGSLQAVVANAGINGVWAPIDDIKAEEWDTTIRVNLRGTYLTLNKTVPLLKKAGGGAIVIVSSINGVRTFTSPGATAYSATKAAQIAIVQQLSLELGRHHIRINAVCPGAIATNIGTSTEIRHKMQTEIPVIWSEGSVPMTEGKPGTAIDVANTIEFLLGDAAAHITGTPVFVDGGQGLLR